jgi:hypothetical protein
MTVPDQGPTQAATYFRKGFGLKGEVEGTLAADYDGSVVDLLRERDHTLTIGPVTVRLAREFGFCYGVTPTRRAANSRTAVSGSSARSSTIRT